MKFACVKHHHVCVFLALICVVGPGFAVEKSAENARGVALSPGSLESGLPATSSKLVPIKNVAPEKEVSDVPPGFEALANQQLFSVLDIYYNNRKITESPATFSSATLEFELPEKIIDALNNVNQLKDSEVLMGVLSGPVPGHLSLVCANNRRYPVCKAPVTDKIAVVLNAGQFRADVFVNPDYLLHDPQEISPFLPPSTAGLSFVNEANYLISGTTSQHHFDDNLINQGKLAYGNARINYDSSYVTSDEQESTNLIVDQLNGEIDYGRFNTKLGIVQTNQVSFMNNEALLGLHFGTTENTLNTYNGSDTDLYAAPLSIYLKLPSRVSFFKDGRLIASRQYTAGEQRVNTSSFPSGSYDITVKIEDDFGTQSTENYFFAKSRRYPPVNYPVYYLNVGYFIDENKDANIFYPTTKIGVLQTGFDRRLASFQNVQVGGRGDLTLSTQRSFMTLGSLLLGERWELESDFLVGTDPDYGINMRFQYNAQPFVFSLAGRQIWSKLNLENDNSQFTFDPLTQTRSTLSANVNYNYHKTSISLGARLSKTKGAEASRLYTASLRQQLYTSRDLRVNLDFKASESEDNQVLFLMTLSIDFQKTKNLDIKTTLGRREDYNQTDVSSSGNIVRTNVKWNNVDNLGYGKSLSFGAGVNVGSENYSSSLSEKNTRYTLNVQGAHSHAVDAESNTGYSGSFSTRLIAIPGAITFGSGRSRSAGVLVRVEGVDNDASFNLLSKRARVGELKAGTNSVALLQPYRAYSLSLSNANDQQYRFSQKPVDVVTYPGNFQLLKWNVRLVYTVFTRILKPDGAPLAYASVEAAEGELNYTDDQGYVQLEVGTDQTEVIFRKKADYCRVNIPERTDPDEVFVNLDDVICQSIKAPAEGAGESYV